MPLNSGVYSVIHAAADADFAAYSYFQVYAGVAATPTINGTAVSMGAGSTLELIVGSISATANVYVIGDKKDLTTGGGGTLSNYPNPS